jgi:ABC-2 type transport system ATP-binding protein
MTEVTQPSPPARPSAGPAPAPAGTLPAPAVQAEGLTKQFGDQFAVRDLTFHVPAGMIFGFIGPSGCGKTTTVRLLTGIYGPTSGKATVLGEQPQHFSTATRSRLGYMPQQFVLYPHLSVWENMNFTASLYGMGLNRGSRLKELLEFVELYPHRRKLARNISGGMQRRLALAATLAHDPQLLFLDEPTAGIDPVLRRKLWDYFATLKERGRTLFVTTQYVGEAAYCDYVAVMAAGRLLMVETPEGLRRRAFGGEQVDLVAAQPLDYRTVAQIRALPFVLGRVQPVGDTGLRLTVQDAGEAVPALIEWAQQANVEVRSVDAYMPPLDDVFVELVQAEQGDEPSE